MSLLVGTHVGDGTTTTAAGLARAFGGHARVLVVDTDLRRPALASHFDLADSPGLTEVLRGDSVPGDVITRRDGVDVVPAGAGVEEPDVLLALPEAAALFRRWRSEYDRVVIDGAPLGPTIDAAVVARHADGVVLVAQEGVTDAVAVAAVAELLRDSGAHVLGSVLTSDTSAPTHRTDAGDPESRHRVAEPGGRKTDHGSTDSDDAVLDAAHDVPR